MALFLSGEKIGLWTKIVLRGIFSAQESHVQSRLAAIAGKERDAQPAQALLVHLSKFLETE